MCSDCDAADFVCPWCGDDCSGICSDPDTCLSCWGDQFDDDTDEDFEYLEYECADDDCHCNCHPWGEREFLGSRVRSFKRKGVFPFLELPGETRQKIYSYAFAQCGARVTIGGVFTPLFFVHAAKFTMRLAISPSRSIVFALRPPLIRLTSLALNWHRL